VRDRAANPGLPTRPEEIQATFDWFREMREWSPVLLDERSPAPFWQVFRYDDVATVLTDHARFSSQTPAFGSSPLADTMLVKDPPDHRKLRNLVNLAFTPRAVAGLSGRVAEITSRLLDQVAGNGRMDVVSDVALPLPSRVIAEMLGLPEEDHDEVGRWARVIEGGLSMRGGVERIRDYFSALLEERRRAPREDLVSALSNAEIDGERLTERELVNFCILLLFAGQETTKNLIANFFLTLSDHPEDQELLTRQPELIPTAIEEVLRYLPPVWFLMRQTTADVELGGVTIPAGQMVLPWTASANRDSRQFPDPDRFDVRRDPNRHLAFGHGIHFCVGAPLARLEARIALPLMLERLRDLRVERETPIGIRAGIVFVIGNLPVRFSPTAA